MASVRSKDTKPEIIVRKFLFSKGLRFRVNDKSLPGKPDIKLTKYRTVVFINGCFWHGHKSCRIYVMPKTNSEFWESKIAKNIIRDRQRMRLLKKMGWKVLVVWECRLKAKFRTKTLTNLLAKIENNHIKYLL